jgi:hypothetical protein
MPLFKPQTLNFNRQTLSRQIHALSTYIKP